MKTIIALTIAVLLSACGSDPVGHAGDGGASAVAGAAGAGLSGGAGTAGAGGESTIQPAPQIDPATCVTELASDAIECDPDHSLVMHCGMVSGVGQAQPIDTCVPGKDGQPAGFTWCCLPSFAKDCAKYGLC